MVRQVLVVRTAGPRPIPSPPPSAARRVPRARPGRPRASGRRPRPRDLGVGAARRGWRAAAARASGSRRRPRGPRGCRRPRPSAAAGPCPSPCGPNPGRDHGERVLGRARPGPSDARSPSAASATPARAGSCSAGGRKSGTTSFVVSSATRVERRRAGLLAHADPNTSSTTRGSTSPRCTEPSSATQSTARACASGTSGSPTARPATVGSSSETSAP